MDLRRAKRTSSKTQSETPSPQASVPVPVVAVSSTSTSSLSAVESVALEIIQCSICFDKVSEQGILNCCSHLFCFECIHTWSKSENKCPVCKRRFENLTRKPLDLDESERPKKRRKLRSKTEDIVEDKPEVIQVPYRNQRNAYEHDMSWLDGQGLFPFEFGLLVQMPTTAEAEAALDLMPLLSNLFDTGARRASNSTANSRSAARQPSRNQTRDRERHQQQPQVQTEQEFQQEGAEESAVPSNLRIVDSEDVRQRYQTHLPSNLSIGRVMVSGPEGVDTSSLFRSLDTVMDTILSTVLAGRFGVDRHGNGNSQSGGFAMNDALSGLADIHIQFSRQGLGNRGQEGRERPRSTAPAAAHHQRRHQRPRDQTQTQTHPSTQTQTQTQTAERSAFERRSRHVSFASSERTRHQQQQHQQQQQQHQQQQHQQQQPPGALSSSSLSGPRSSGRTFMSSSSSSHASTSHPSSNITHTNNTSNNTNNNSNSNSVNNNNINDRSRSRSSRRQGGQDRT